MSILEEDNNLSKCFGPYKDEKCKLDKQDIKRDHRNLVSKSSDIRSCIKNNLLRCIFQDRYFASESSLSLKEVKSSI